MKVFFSCDIEGTAGIAHLEECGEGEPSHWAGYFRERMTAEVAAACESALGAGAAEILVKDAHDTARNILPKGLPRGVRINRGWSGTPYCMVDGAQGFDAMGFIGFHGEAGNGGSPLSHTMYGRLYGVEINGTAASEFTIHSYAAGYMDVPVVFLSGDAALCRDAKEFLPGITTVATGEGLGGSITGTHPGDAEEAIRAGVARALAWDFFDCRVMLPPCFEVVVRYKEHPDALRASFYPGAKLLESRAVLFENKDYYEVLRFFQFVL